MTVWEGSVEHLDRNILFWNLKYALPLPFYRYPGPQRSPWVFKNRCCALSFSLFTRCCQPEEHRATAHPSVPCLSPLRGQAGPWGFGRCRPGAGPPPCSRRGRSGARVMDEGPSLCCGGSGLSQDSHIAKGRWLKSCDVLIVCRWNTFLDSGLRLSRYLQERQLGKNRDGL